MHHIMSWCQKWSREYYHSAFHSGFADHLFSLVTEKMLCCSWSCQAIKNQVAVFRKGCGDFSFKNQRSAIEPSVRIFLAWLIRCKHNPANIGCCQTSVTFRAPTTIMYQCAQVVRAELEISGIREVKKLSLCRVWLEFHNSKRFLAGKILWVQHQHWKSPQGSAVALQLNQW